jgi:biopolymer transport protein ExbD
MSHGPSASSQHVEPNLTPLLDLVLQLLMFFIIVTNFSAAQSYEKVDLAHSDTASLPDDTASSRPTNAGEADYLFLTVKPYVKDDFTRRITDQTDQDKVEKDFPTDGLPCVVRGANPVPIKPDDDLDVWLKTYVKDTKKAAADGQLHTTIVLRTDGKIEYEVVYRIMNLCKTQGFPKLRVRAMVEKVDDK